ncbi:hypothetical protein NDR87_31895 [Nocardia sp. CDC159]|uniref:Uncharacterized protein n=1 Tax=Nocardia pulmonis TaxID=2951408 RepID=A0A9X2EC12_9NOCA|nr:MULTISPECIES: hypothetical protein [Nocardia]MCM6778094.1 hypothetical protein [Nocardia pulmonis]MCM6790983.1 hypothetical protein [Nocardia sp. CDC159]
MSTSNSGANWRRGLGGLALGGAVIASALITTAVPAAADPGLPLTREAETAQVADDGCTFSSVGGSCSDPGPVGHAVIAFRSWLVSLGYGTGSSSLSAQFF